MTYYSNPKLICSSQLEAQLMLYYNRIYILNIVHNIPHVHQAYYTTVLWTCNTPQCLLHYKYVRVLTIDTPDETRRWWQHIQRTETLRVSPWTGWVVVPGMEWLMGRQHAEGPSPNGIKLEKWRLNKLDPAFNPAYEGTSEFTRCRSPKCPKPERCGSDFIVFLFGVDRVSNLYMMKTASSCNCRFFLLPNYFLPDASVFGPLKWRVC